MLILAPDVCLESFQAIQLLEIIAVSFVREAKGLAYAPDFSQSARVLASTVAVMLAVLKAETIKPLLVDSTIDLAELGAWLLVLPPLATALSTTFSGLSLQWKETHKLLLLSTGPEVHISAKVQGKAIIATFLASRKTPLRYVFGTQHGRPRC